jgi:hypothetical protein
VSGRFEILFEGQTHATVLTAEIAVQTLAEWSLHARGLPGGEALYDRLNGLRRGEVSEPLVLTRGEARLLAEVFESARFEELRTLLARARGAVIE